MHYTKGCRTLEMTIELNMCNYCPAGANNVVASAGVEHEVLRVSQT